MQMFSEKVRGPDPYSPSPSPMLPSLSMGDSSFEFRACGRCALSCLSFSYAHPARALRWMAR